MDIPLTTELFRFTTAACPEAVWQTLLSPEQTGRYFHGFTLESDWRPGSPVTADAQTAGNGGGRLVGEVLSVQEPGRLSFTLAAGDDQPETFVTWELHRGDEGSIVRLYVDEPERDADTKRVWMPVVAALQSVLAEQGRKASPTSR